MRCLSRRASPRSGSRWLWTPCGWVVRAMCCSSQLRRLVRGVVQLLADHIEQALAPAAPAGGWPPPPPPPPPPPSPPPPPPCSVREQIPAHVSTRSRCHNLLGGIGTHPPPIRYFRDHKLRDM